MVIFIALPLHSLLRKSSVESEKNKQKIIDKIGRKKGKKKSERKKMQDKLEIIFKKILWRV